MLRELCRNANIKMIEIAKTMEIKPQLLNKIVKCEFYAKQSVYNQVYDILEEAGSRVPRQNNLTLYPSEKAVGAWDIFYEDEFLSTLVFKDLNDIYLFLDGSKRGDFRFELLSRMRVKKEDVVFNNKVSKKTARGA